MNGTLKAIELLDQLAEIVRSTQEPDPLAAVAVQDTMRRAYYNLTIDTTNPASGRHQPQIQDDGHEEPYDGGELVSIDRRPTGGLEGANLVSSLCYDDYHRPALDIDVPCHYVPSSTGGHGHLYFPTVAMDWPMYRMLLDVLAYVGIIDPNYRDASVMREQSLLRPPGVTKTSGPIGDR